MAIKKTTSIEIVDEDHIWVDGTQFISLKRFYENRKDVADEMILLNNRVKELAEKVNALNTLIKNERRARCLNF